MYSPTDYQLSLEVHQDALASANNHRLARSTMENSIQPSFPTWIKSIRRMPQQAFSFLQDTQRKRRSNSIIQSAARTFVQLHPEMAKECFDAHFLTQRANTLLHDFIVAEQPYSARVLASLWAAQFGVSESAHKALSQAATHMAAEFLYVLELTIKASERRTVQQRDGLQAA